MAHSSSKFMYYSRRLTILQTNIDHAPVDGLKHLRNVNCRNRKRIKMDKLTDRPAGKRTNKPTDERMTEETESQNNWNCIKRIAPVVFPQYKKTPCFLFSLEYINIIERNSVK